MSFSNPYADVTMEKVTVAGQEVPKMAVMVKDDDNNQVLSGMHGVDYDLIPNAMARDVADDVMSRSGKQWDNLKTLWDGKRYINYWYTKDALVEVKNGANYPLHLGMMIRNSYDGSSVFGMEFYIMNAICTNQFIYRKAMGFFVIKHTGNEGFDIQDAIGSIGSGAQKLIDIAPAYREMTRIDLNLDHIKKANELELVPNNQWGNVIEQLRAEPDAGKMFGFYQALTFVSSHKMTGLSAIKHGNGITEHFMGIVGR